MLPIEYIIVIVALIAAVVGAAVIRWKIREAALEKDIVHILYKGEFIPIRQVDKVTWGKLSGEAKREYWKSLQRAFRKGKLIKVEVGGKPMYIATKKGGQERANAEAYEKMVRNS